MYNIANHYENIFQYLQTIVTDPRVLYLHPFGATQPENIEVLRDDRNPPNRRGPLFIFFDQEPLHTVYNQDLFSYIKINMAGPHVLISTEKISEDKDAICSQFRLTDINYFFHIFAAADWYRGHEYLPGLVDPKNRNLKKTYITFNRITSKERVYRSLFVSELIERDLLKDGHVSFSQFCPEGGAYDQNLIQAIPIHKISPVLVKAAIANIKQLPELRIDFGGEVYIPNQSMLLSPLPQLMESFVFVVTETCFWQNKTHLTEKIFKPILLKMPFLLVGCANNLEYLRSYGFRTFSDYWDESYDTIMDPIQRLRAVADTLKTINQLSPAQQKSMLLDMQPVLDHNYRLFNDPNFILKEWNHLKAGLKSAVPI